MPVLALGFVRLVEAVNRRVGRMALYLLFVLAGVLAWSVIATQPAIPRPTGSWTPRIRSAPATEAAT